jgi:eukaryotic-like serine/threonine-protein kinase
MLQANAVQAEWDQSTSPPRSDAHGLAPNEAALALHGLQPGRGGADLDSWGDSRRDQGSNPRRRESDDIDGKLARLTDGLVALPEVGQEFLGFHLIGDLGRGAFGRVYLARQGDLADRPVALKVSTGCLAESQKLARLQHTHIVPIHSFHRAGPLQAVCMPYLGSATLADVLEDLGQRQTLPESGKGLISTLNSHRSRRGGVAPPLPSAAALVAPSHALEHPPATPLRVAEGPAVLTTLRMLEGMTYVEAVLWIGARLAEGLAHAHERGVLHRDLKPANVLLTDEGQPMLLDFNLAEDVKAAGAAGARVGGTLPYMAPEHLAAYQGQPATVDARSDIYALGVILYELLTGRHPFAKHPGPADGVLALMLQDRTRPPAPARSLNSGVSPAVDSIVRRCLEPNPARRYQAARELQEDLDRQRLHQPLRYARDPSPRERIAKWLRRNPRTVTATRVGAAALVLLLLLTIGLFWKGEQLARHESTDRFKGFHDDLTTARLLLGARAADVDQLTEGREAAQRALERFQVGAGDHWRDPPSALRLSAEEKDRLKVESGELLLLLASARARPNLSAGDDVKRQEDLQEALRMNRLAETCYPENQAPHALWAQRALLESMRGRDEEAQQLRKRADETPMRDVWDEYLLARDQASSGRLADAAERLRAVAAREPDNFAVQFLMGNCCLDGFIDRLGQETDAVGCYSACIALRPDFHAAYANRGLVRLRRCLWEEAEADFTRAIELRPNRAEYHLYRAEAREGLRKDEEELGDLNEAEELGSKAILLHYMRARVQQRLGRDISARRDLDWVLRQAPTDEEGFVSRGVARASDGDMKAALDDFAQAVKLNPNSVAGLQDQASVLAEQLGRNQEALAPLDRLLELYPAFAQARGTRAVIRARLGLADEARADALKARELDPDGGAVRFQTACVYSLLGRERETDKAEAFRLLCQALQKGYGWEQLVHDEDLAPLRNDPRFTDLTRTAGMLQAGGNEEARHVK